MSTRRYFLLAPLFIFLLAFLFIVWTRPHHKGHALNSSACAVSAQLVNACRPWVGATVGGYSQAGSDTLSQLHYLNKRLNNPNVLTNPGQATTVSNKIDIAHVYHQQGSNLFSNSVKNVLNDATFPYVFVNWKPLPAGYTWQDAGGGNATVNNYIKTGAQSVKALGSRKIFLTVWHEPENDVSSGNCASNASGASMGSPASYVAMWQNVRAIFNQEGVSNVVWVMNYMGYSKWNCLVPMLWPGNSNVDWVVYDPYSGGGESYSNGVQNLYSYLSQNSDSAHAYTSKPWGLAEHGYNNANGNSSESNAATYWNQAKAAIDSYPNLKMYLVFDTNVNGTTQVGLTFGGQPSVTEQTAFNGFANAILAKQSGSGGGSTGGATPVPQQAAVPPATASTAPTAQSAPQVETTTPTAEVMPPVAGVESPQQTSNLPQRVAAYVANRPSLWVAIAGVTAGLAVGVALLVRQIWLRGPRHSAARSTLTVQDLQRNLPAVADHEAHRTDRS